MKKVFSYVRFYISAIVNREVERVNRIEMKNIHPFYLYLEIGEKSPWNRKDENVKFIFYVIPIYSQNSYCSDISQIFS